VLWLTNRQPRVVPKECSLDPFPSHFVTGHPSVPLQPATLGATMPSVQEIFSNRGNNFALPGV